jgi:hypothetical protein
MSEFSPFVKQLRLLPIFLLILLLISCGLKTQQFALSNGKEDREASTVLSDSDLGNACLSEFIKWENTFNHAVQKSTDPVRLRHYNVPIRLVTEDMNEALESFGPTRRAMVFKKDGEEYVRWVINPTDESQHLDIAKLLKSNNLDSATHEYFWGWSTASRSYVVKDPGTGYVFSLKTSTMNPGGDFRAKRLQRAEVEIMRATSDYAQNWLTGPGFRHLVLQEEAWGAFVTSQNIGLLARSLGDLTTCKKRLLPMFSAFYPGIENEIPMSSQPEFIKQHVYGSFGRASAEFFATLGLVVTSSHTQNFLLELNLDGTPTGRVVYRDFADGNVIEDFAKSAGAHEYARIREEGHHLERLQIHLDFIPSNGNSKVAQLIPNGAEEKFYESFRSTLLNLTGIILPEESPRHGLNGMVRLFFQKEATPNPEAWNNWLKAAPCYLQAKAPANLPDPERRKAIFSACGI